MVSQLKTRMDRYGMFAVAGAAAAAAGGAHTADAGIVYSGAQNLDIPGNITGVYIDMDGDAVDDANFYLSAPAVRWFGPQATADAFTALNDGTYIQNLNAGDLIDSSGFTTVPTFNGLIGYGYGYGETFNPPNNSGYVGVSILVGGNTHYGWIQLANLTEISDGNGNNGVVVDWAYNDVAGASIEAGQVPEPGSLALLALGAVGMMTRRKKSA